MLLHRSLLLGAAIGSGLVAALVGTAALANGSPQVINACYQREEGDLRILSTGTCHKDEIPISWNQAGVPGPAGPQGPQGPAGPAGPAGSSTLSATSLQGQAERIVSGSTTAGQTSWQVYTPTIITLHVDTTAAGFTATPTYVASLAGNSWTFFATGGSAIYNASPTGFDVYVSFVDQRTLAPADANSFGWHLNWMAAGS